MDSTGRTRQEEIKQTTPAGGKIGRLTPGGEDPGSASLILLSFVRPTD